MRNAQLVYCKFADLLISYRWKGDPTWWWSHGLSWVLKWPLVLISIVTGGCKCEGTHPINSVCIDIRNPLKLNWNWQIETDESLKTYPTHAWNFDLSIQIHILAKQCARQRLNLQVPRVDPSRLAGLVPLKQPRNKTTTRMSVPKRKGTIFPHSEKSILGRVLLLFVGSCLFFFEKMILWQIQNLVGNLSIYGASSKPKPETARFQWWLTVEWLQISLISDW